MSDNQIRIIQNFTNFKHNKQFRETELLIWAANLVQFKKFGYYIKLYCTPDSIPFLKEWHLIELYDEIDSEYLNQDSSILKQVDEEHFWSSRKIEALYHELIELKVTDPVVYSDVDIIMKIPFNLDDCDCMFWSPEEWSDEEGNIYVNWSILSTSENYQMPDYIKEMGDAYNCGIIYFKNPEHFKEYRKAYYDFVLGNPCQFIKQEGLEYDFDDLTKQNNVWACNAEQRILRGVVTHLDLKVHCIMRRKRDGRGYRGEHYFIYRMCWKKLEDYLLPPHGWREVLNEVVFLALTILKDNNEEIYNYWVSRPWLKYKDFLNTYDPLLMIYPIAKYH